MIRFVTGNDGKVREARAYLDENIEQNAYDYTEVQSTDLATIAAHGAREAYHEIGDSVMVEDSGLFVESLGGFPGPYSSYAYETLGIERIWRLTEPEDEHGGTFRSVIGYCDGSAFPDADYVIDGDPPVGIFEGSVHGQIVAPRGEGGFGYDPIFEYDGQTFAELTADQKNEVSHRGRALETFAEWHASR